MTPQEFWDLTEQVLALPWMFCKSTSRGANLRNFSSDPFEVGYCFGTARLEDITIAVHPWGELDTSNTPEFKKVTHNDAAEDMVREGSRRIGYDIYYHRFQLETMFKRRLEVRKEQTVQQALTRLITSPRFGRGIPRAVNAVVRVTCDVESSLSTGTTIAEAVVNKLLIDLGAEKREDWKPDETYSIKTHLDAYPYPEKHIKKETKSE